MMNAGEAEARFRQEAHAAETVCVEKTKAKTRFASLTEKKVEFLLLYLFSLNRLFITATKGKEQLLCRLHSAAQPHRQ